MTANFSVHMLIVKVKKARPDRSLKLHPEKSERTEKIAHAVMKVPEKMIVATVAEFADAMLVLQLVELLVSCTSSPYSI